MSSTKKIIYLSIFNSIVKMLMVSLSFFLGIYFESIGLSGAEIGMIFAVGTLTSIITILPSGFSNDKFKSKHLITVALILMGLQYIGLSITKEFPLIITIFFFGEIGKTLYSSSSDSLFHKSTKKKNISKKIGIFHGINYLVMGLGIIAAGYLKEINISFEQIFQFLGIGLFIMAIIGGLTLPKSITAKLDFIDYKSDIKQPKVIFFLIIMFLFAIHFGAESTTYGLFLKKTLGLSPLEMGIYMGTSIMAMAGSVFIISKYTEKIKIKYILLFGLFASGSGHILMTISDPIISMIFRIYHEAGDAAMFFFLYYGISKLFDLKRIGGNSSIFTLTQTFAGATGAIIFGAMGAAWGYNWPLIISGGTTLLAFILSLQFIHHFDHE